MTKPKMTADISLGQVIQITVLLVGMVAAFLTVQHTGAATAELAEKNRVSVVHLTTRIVALEKNDALNDQRLKVLNRDLAEIKSEVSETNNLLRQWIRGATASPRQ
ncbi:MAG: hypothetical protein ACRBBO_15515 [Cognatishimia sp.]